MYVEQASLRIDHSVLKNSIVSEISLRIVNRLAMSSTDR